jgi:beta-glucanase (GH16 family)
MKFGWISSPVFVGAIPLSAAAASSALPWVDQDSPIEACTTRSYSDGSTLSLVYSDEFNVPGRSFADGSDPRWTAVNKNDYTNEALHYYNADLVTTNGGHLNITTTSQPISFNIGYKGRTKATKNFQTGMQD